MNNKHRLIILAVLILVITYMLMPVLLSIYNKKNIVWIYNNYYPLMTYDALVYNIPYAFKALGYTFILSSGLMAILFLFSLKKESDLYGHAKFANEKDIKKAGLYGEKGIVIGKNKKRLLCYGGDQFVALQAPTRSGKGVSVVIPNLLNWVDSAVILDIKQECFNITSKYRKERLGQQVFLFDPFSYKTHRYNPLGYIDFESATGEIDLSRIASVLFPAVGKDLFWADNARILFCGLVYLLNDLIKNNLTTLKMNLKSVLLIKDGLDGKSLEDVFYENENVLSSKTKQNLTKFFSIASENTSSGITSTFDSTLSIYGIDVIANATSENDFDLRDLRKQKITIYLGILPSNLIQCSRLVNLFFSQLIIENTQQLPQDNAEIKHRCLILLDEMTSIGYMEVILKGCAFISGYWLRLLMVYQSRSQLSAHEPIGYGVTGAKTLTDNSACNLIFTPKQDDAKEYSDTLGYQTVKSKSSSNGRGSVSHSESDAKRPLMLPQELKEMPLNEEIIMIDGVKPIKCNKAYYYNDPYFVDKLKSVSPTIAKCKDANVGQDVYAKAIQKGELSVKIEEYQQ